MVTSYLLHPDTFCKSPKMATIWKFRNSDDNFKKLLSVFTQMFIHFVWEGIAKTLDTSQNLLLVFTERWIHVQEFHHIRISFSEGNFKKPLLVFLVCPLFCFEQRRCLRSDAALLRTTTQSAATYVVCRCASTRSTAARYTSW